jgi:hypothetical protein
VKYGADLWAYVIMSRVTYELRIPTVERLLCDVMGVVNCDARALIVYLVEEGKFKETKGWIKAI